MRYIHLKQFFFKLKGQLFLLIKEKHSGRNKNFSPKKKDGGKKY